MAVNTRVDSEALKVNTDVDTEPWSHSDRENGYCIDCGEYVGYSDLFRESDFDERLFGLSTGALFAYFERGNSRFLTLVSPGSYGTPDGTNCAFTVDSNGKVVW